MLISEYVQNVPEKQIIGVQAFLKIQNRDILLYFADSLHMKFKNG